MKNYIGISRDHSGSMRNIKNPAMKDYNSNIETIKKQAEKHEIDTIVSVVKCGVGPQAKVEREVVNSSVNFLKPIDYYETDGNATPLFDSVGDLIEQFQNVPDYEDSTVSFIISVITDGCENSSRKWSGNRLSEKIRALQISDRWTFTFRVPYGQKRHLMGFGIPEGNILEWEQTEKGMRESTEKTEKAFGDFYSLKASGVNSSRSFYANIGEVSDTEIKNTLVDVSKEVKFLKVTEVNDGMQIRDFIEKITRNPYDRGTVFYQLTKSVKLQEYKVIAIQDKLTGAVYSGFSARDLLGLPRVGQVNFRPGNQGKYEVFVQSTSVNRKVLKNTRVMIWDYLKLK